MQTRKLLYVIQWCVSQTTTEIVRYEIMITNLCANFRIPVAKFSAFVKS